MLSTVLTSNVYKNNLKVIKGIQIIMTSLMYKSLNKRWKILMREYDLHVPPLTYAPVSLYFL